MNRSVFLVLLLSIVHYGSSHHDRKGHRGRSQDLFHKLSHKHIWIEKKFAYINKDNMNSGVREMYGTHSYILKYPMKGIKETDVVVKVLHKTILVSTVIPIRNPVRDVMKLPDNVVPEAASWYLKDEDLVVTFPYKSPIGTEVEMDRSGSNINYSVITVPMSVPEPDPTELLTKTN